MMRKRIITGNWKMNKTIKEAVELVAALKRELVDIEDVDIVVCPPYTALSDVRELLIDTNIKLGAQDLYWEKEGAYTGEVSAQMLKDAGCEYVIVGHSERRKYFGETNMFIGRKANAALQAGLLPIVCVGETLDEREKGMTYDVVKDHVSGSFRGLTGGDMKKVILAYEPVWAIGTGKNATPQQAEDVHRFIRSILSDMFDEETAANIRIQYGGSVSPANIKELIEEKDIDGALVGGASLKADLFSQIVKASTKL